MTEQVIERPKRSLRQRVRTWLGLAEPLSGHALVLATLEAMYYAEEEWWEYVEPLPSADRPNDSFVPKALAGPPIKN